MLQKSSATMTISTAFFFHFQKTCAVPSKVARFGNEFSELFQVLLVFFVKAVLDSTIDVDDSDNLYERMAISFTVLKQPCTFLISPIQI